MDAARLRLAHGPCCGGMPYYQGELGLSGVAGIEKKGSLAAKRVV